MASIPASPAERKIWIVLYLALALNIALWFHARSFTSRWTNVPPVPSQISATASGLGDHQFAYRIIGIMLQNLGDTGGRTTGLAEYDYEELSKWFLLEHRLDPHSNFIPFLAAFYFGGTKNPEKLRPLIEYLRVAGNSTEGEKWRWLAHASYLARFKLNDYDLALELANKLAQLPKDDMPAWTRNMPALVLNARGDREAAFNMLLEILKSSADKMHPNEVNATRDYICTRILTLEEAAANPLCENL